MKLKHILLATHQSWYLVCVCVGVATHKPTTWTECQMRGHLYKMIQTYDRQRSHEREILKLEHMKNSILC